MIPRDSHAEICWVVAPRSLLLSLPLRRHRDPWLWEPTMKSMKSMNQEPGEPGITRGARLGALPSWRRSGPKNLLVPPWWPCSGLPCDKVPVLCLWFIYTYIFLSITEPLLNVKGHFTQSSSVAWRPSGQIVQLIEIQIVYQHLPHFPRQVSTVNLQPCSLYRSCGYAESTRNLAFALTFCNILQCNGVQVLQHLIARFHIFASAVARAGWLIADAA